MLQLNKCHHREILLLMQKVCALTCDLAEKNCERCYTHQNSTVAHSIRSVDNRQTVLVLMPVRSQLHDHMAKHGVMYCM
jgi:hypothetical protein